MNEFALIEIIQEPNALWVMLGVCFLAISTSCIGTFAWLNRQSLIGDAMAHCALPGIAVAFLFSQSRHPFILLPVAILSSLLGNALLNWLIERAKLSADSALAIVLSGFFAIGAMVLSIIQKMPIAGKAGIDQMLFGQAAALDDFDVNVLIFLACLVIIFVMLLLTRLRMVIFNPQFALSIGISVAAYKQIMGLLIVICVVIGIQVVGVILISSLLIFPAINARQWSSNLHKLLLISATTALLASLFGVLVSYSYDNMPTGPWIVVFLALFLIFSLLFSPRSGYFIKAIKDYHRQKIIYAENIIRLQYLSQSNNQRSECTTEFTISDILKMRSMPPTKLKKGLKYAIGQKWIKSVSYGYQLSDLGFAKAETITRHHRLWEQYLSANKKLPHQMIHRSAEYAEHIIDEELADKLDELLGHPNVDPHGQSIPVKK